LQQRCEAKCKLVEPASTQYTFAPRLRASWRYYGPRVPPPLRCRPLWIDTYPLH
jgi:hypothetical protein